MRYPSPDPLTAQDIARLDHQHEAIRNLMLDGEWRTFREIAEELNPHWSEASISAQLRHLRKPKFGSYKVNRKRRENSGLNEYQVIPTQVFQTEMFAA